MCKQQTNKHLTHIFTCNRLHQNAKYYHTIDCIKYFKDFHRKACKIKKLYQGQHSTLHHASSFQSYNTAYKTKNEDCIPATLA